MNLPNLKNKTMNATGFKLLAVLASAACFLGSVPSARAQKDGHKQVRVVSATSDSLSKQQATDTVYIKTRDNETQTIIIKSRKKEGGKTEVEATSSGNGSGGTQTVTVIKKEYRGKGGKKTGKHITTAEKGNKTTVIIEEEVVKDKNNENK